MLVSNFGQAQLENFNNLVYLRSGKFVESTEMEGTLDSSFTSKYGKILKTFEFRILKIQKVIVSFQNYVNILENICILLRNNR